MLVFAAAIWYFRFMDFIRIAYAVAGRHATITMRRPEKRNALDDDMIRELIGGFTSAARDPAVKTVTLKGEGPAFCAGADLESLRRIAKSDLEENRADSSRLAHLYKFIYELRKPVIAVVGGPALAGGCGLTCVCDFVLASQEHAAFGYPEVHIGFIPAVVLVFLVKRIGEGRARELALRGNTITADEACALGLVTCVVPHSTLETSAAQLAEELAEQNSGASMALIKETLARLQGMNFHDGLDFAANMNATARMTQDCKQGVDAFLAKKKVTW